MKSVHRVPVIYSEFGDVFLIFYMVALIARLGS